MSLSVYDLDASWVYDSTGMRYDGLWQSTVATGTGSWVAVSTGTGSWASVSTGTGSWTEV